MTPHSKQSTIRNYGAFFVYRRILDQLTISYPSKSIPPKLHGGFFFFSTFRTPANLLPTYLRYPRAISAHIKLSDGFFDKSQSLFSILQSQQFSIDITSGKVYPYWEGFPTGNTPPERTTFATPHPFKPYL